MTDLEYSKYLQSPQWKRIANKRLIIDDFECQGCGSRGTILNVLETHHLSYKHLGNEEEWVYQDLVTVCHCCHKLLHNIMNRQTASNGRRGWKDNSNIPKLCVFDLSESGSVEWKEKTETKGETGKWNIPF